MEAARAYLRTNPEPPTTTPPPTRPREQSDRPRRFTDVPALLQLVDDGSVRAIMHAGPAVYKLFGKSVAECEMNPGQTKHLSSASSSCRCPTTRAS